MSKVRFSHLVIENNEGGRGGDAKNERTLSDMQQWMLKLRNWFRKSEVQVDASLIN